ncbi:MAG: tetratricopeptide repeat protein [Prevotellaceae bacterium]|nr:tetratricopeptide repeat protein [Prevotellaceae bacterium]
MKRFLFPILLLFLPLLLVAQSQQQVQVREYKEKAQKTPLEGVSLSVQNAGSTMSDAQGLMTLQFRTLKAGDQVQVRRVDLTGYEIFNSDAVEQWTISPQNTFNLVLCRSDRFKQLRDNYMRISSASYERQYKQDQARLAALRKENKLQEEAYQQQLADLENSYYEQLDNLENYVDRFTRIDLSELSEQEQHLIELVQEGKIDEAIQLYESADYLSQYNAQVNDLKEINRAQAALAKVEAEKLEAREKVQAAIHRQVQTYQLAGGRENFSKISALLKGVADADTTNLDAVWAYGDHCLDQNKFDECEKYMNIYMRQSVDNKKAQALSCLNLGRLYGSKYLFDSAEKYYLQAVALAKQGYKEEPDLFLSLYNDAECVLHTLYIYLNKQEEALLFSDTLKERLESCYQQDESLWRSKLAIFLGEMALASFQIDNKYDEKNESLLLRSYNLSKQEMEETQNSEYLINSIIYLNKFYYYTQQWDRMEPFMLEELKYREENYAKNPNQEVRYLLDSYINLTELYYNLNKYTESHSYLEKAFNILNSVLQIYEESTVEFNKMNLYDAASQLYYKEGNIEKTRQYASQCIEAFEKIPDELKDGLEELVQRNQDYLK